MSKKVLFIAPSSYPVNSPEAIVNIKLLELLSNNGYEIDLISKKIKWDNYPSNQTLNDLNVKINKNIIVEVDNKFNFKTLLQHLFVYVIWGTVFKGAHWAYEVIFNNKSFFADNKYDYVITKNSPSLLVGYYLKKKYGIKWIASWNDPYPHVKYPKPYGKGKDFKLPFYHRKILSIMDTADIHIFPNTRLKDYMLTYLNVDSNKAVVIPHLAGKFSNEKVPSSTLRLVHSGNVRSPRDPKIIVEAFAKLIKGGDTNIKLDFIGVYDSDLRALIEKLELTDYIRLLPPVDYKESLNLLSNYDIALIIEAHCEEGIFLPTKVGDYMSYNIPIFTISPKIGILNDLHQNNYIQYFAEINQLDSIYTEFKNIYSNYQDGAIKKSLFNESYSELNILKQYDSI